MRKIIWLLLILGMGLQTMAQKGKIRGTVYEEATGESLVGVTVFLTGTTIGTTTDLDGKFSIDADPGSYQAQISYISFQTILINDVQVKAGEVTMLENLVLKEVSLELSEVVVSAEVIRRTESALLTIKKKSAVILDGISSSKIKLTGDATAVEAAKRVTGVSVEDGKYVYVRGLGDRYSKTMLNQVDIPGLDPDRNSLQMDIFPTNLIDNIFVSKNYTADMPADFTGGMLNIETKDFPEEKSISVSLGLTYNPSMHFNSDWLTYEGGSTDMLGFDDGTRALPARAGKDNIPTPISGASDQEVFDFVTSFDSQLAAKQKTSFMDYSMGISMGNQIDLGKKKGDPAKKRKLGYVFSLSYKTDTKFYDEVIFGEYQRYIDPNLYEMRYATIQTGQLGEQNVLLGALGGLAYKTDHSKIRLTLMHLQNGESRAGKFYIVNDGEAVGQSGYRASSDNIEYNQRSLTNGLLNGLHLWPTTGWEIDWRISPTYSTSNDPDIRKTAFTYQPLDTLFSGGAGGNPSRIWRSLEELNNTSKIDLSKKHELMKRDARLKFGLSHIYKQRDYEILFFDMQFFGTQSWTNPDPAHVLDAENIYPNKPNSIYYQSGNRNPNPNTYASNINNFAAYISEEFNPLPKLKTIVGVRIEYYVQKHTGRDQTYASGDIINGKNLDNDKVLESTDLFPSVNLIYALSDEQNLRISYSRTIARPSFKELSFAQIIDPISNRIFNGSLFTYSGWDGNLTETRINNFDIRWEWYLPAGQMYSVSGFYKTFDNPIELVRIPEQQTSTEYQPRNVGDGQLYGVELEFRKDLSFIAIALNKLSVNGNLTLVKSSIDMTDTEYNSRKTYEKAGESIENNRVMAGQSPFVVNAGITYSDPDHGLDAGVFYNVKGTTLSIVGAGLFPDIYADPFNSLNFSLNKRFGKDKRTMIDFKVSNLLNEKVVSHYRSYEAEDQVYSSLNPGISVGLGVSYQF
ncbi:MAG: TonB-dependent receptor [Bacteroidales bacterium]|nr:TonB-dependent receptor [Bacteroidales bacterium]